MSTYKYYDLIDEQDEAERDRWLAYQSEWESEPREADLHSKHSSRWAACAAASTNTHGLRPFVHDTVTGKWWKLPAGGEWVEVAANEHGGASEVAPKPKLPPKVAYARTEYLIERVTRWKLDRLLAEAWVQGGKDALAAKAELKTIERLRASLAKRSVPTMDPVWTAAFNDALDMVTRDVFGGESAPPLRSKLRSIG